MLSCVFRCSSRLGGTRVERDSARGSENLPSPGLLRYLGWCGRLTAMSSQTGTHKWRIVVRRVGFGEWRWETEYWDNYWAPGRNGKAVTQRRALKKARWALPVSTVIERA